MVHPESRILFSTKKKWAIKPWKDMEEPYMHIAKEGNLKTLCTIWLQAYYILEKAKLCQE